MKRLNSKTSKRCAELTARPFVRSLTGAVSRQYWSAGSQAGDSLREAEGALLQGIDVVRRLVLCSATENGDSASGVKPYSFSQEQCNAAAEAFVVFSLRYLETLVLAQFASVLQANGLWPNSAETPKHSVIEVTNNDQRTHAQHGVAGHPETLSRQLERACSSEESYTASSTSTGTTTVADTESSISSASGDSAVTERTQAGSISAFTDSAGANASTLAITSPSHCESQRIATRPTSGSIKDGPLSSPAASAVRKDSVGLCSAKAPFLSLFTINRFRKAAALKRAAAAKQLPCLLPGSNRRQVRAAEGLSLVWRSKAKAQLTLLKQQRLQLESKYITGLDSIGSTNDATTDSIRIADMREAAVDLVRKHQTRIKKVNVGRLANLLSACGLWPIQGHRLEQLIESEPRLQLHVKKREWYVTLSARGRAQKASASSRFSPLSIIHTASSAAISPGIGFNNAQTTSGASPGAADADASAEKDQSASQGPVVELALRRLRAAAVQLLLDHKDNGNERMLTGELGEQLQECGVWPIQGYESKLAVALLEDKRLFRAVERGNSFMSVRHVKPGPDTNLQCQAVCDAAVEVLKAHFAWHLQSEERASQSSVHLHALAIHLLDEGVWPLEGTTLVRLLQADARLEVKKSPLGWHLCLTPAMQAAMTARSAGSPVCDAMASPDATALSISSCATVQPGAASAPASPPLQQQAHERAQQTSQLAGQQQAKLGTAFLAACQPEQQQQLPPGTSPPDVCTGLTVPHVSAFAAATASIGEMVCAAGGLTDAVSNGSTAGNEAASLQEQEAGPLTALSAQLDLQQKHAGSSRNPMHVMHVVDTDNITNCSSSSISASSSSHDGISSGSSSSSSGSTLSTPGARSGADADADAGASLHSVPSVVRSPSAQQELTHMQALPEAGVQEQSEASHKGLCMHPGNPPGQVSVPLQPQELQVQPHVVFYPGSSSTCASSSAAAGGAGSPGPRGPVPVWQAASIPKPSDILAVRAKKLCNAAAELVMLHQARSDKRLLVAVLAVHLKARKAWPVKGVKLIPTLQADLRFLIEMEGTVAYVAMRSGAMTAETPALLSEAASAVASGKATVTRVVKDSEGRKSKAAAAASNAVKASSLADQLTKLRNSAVLLVLEHQARSDERLDLAVLTKRLHGQGLWPIEGVGQRALKALKGDVRLSFAREQSACYVNLRHSQAALSRNPKHRALCDMAVEALSALKQQQQQNKKEKERNEQNERNEQQQQEGGDEQDTKPQMLFDLLVKALLKQQAWLFKGYVKVLQADPRFIFAKKGKAMYVALWPDYGAALQSAAPILAAGNAKSGMSPASLSAMPAAELSTSHRPESLKADKGVPSDTAALEPQKAEAGQSVSMDTVCDTTCMDTVCMDTEPQLLQSLLSPGADSAVSHDLPALATAEVQSVAAQASDAVPVILGLMPSAAGVVQLPVDGGKERTQSMMAAESQAIHLHTDQEGVFKRNEYDQPDGHDSGSSGSSSSTGSVSPAPSAARLEAGDSLASALLAVRMAFAVRPSDSTPQTSKKEASDQHNALTPQLQHGDSSSLEAVGSTLSSTTTTTSIATTIDINAAVAIKSTDASKGSSSSTAMAPPAPPSPAPPSPAPPSPALPSPAALTALLLEAGESQSSAAISAVRDAFVDILAARLLVKERVKLADIASQLTTAKLWPIPSVPASKRLRLMNIMVEDPRLVWSKEGGMSYISLTAQARQQYDWQQQVGVEAQTQPSSPVDASTGAAVAASAVLGASSPAAASAKARRAQLCAVAVELVQEHMAHTHKPLNLVALAARLHARCVWPIPGERLLTALEAEPQLRLWKVDTTAFAALRISLDSAEPRQAGIGLETGGIAEGLQLLPETPKPVPSTLAGAAAAAPVTLTGTTAKCTAASKGGKVAAATAAAAASDAKGLLTAEAAAVAADALRSTTVLFLLEHQARSDQPLNTIQLAAYLAERRAWPVEGLPRLRKVLATDPRISMRREGNEYFYSVPQSRAASSVNKEHRAVCDVAVEVLEAHLDQQQNTHGQEVVQGSMYMGLLANIFSERQVWPVKGSSLLKVLQEDPRLVVAKEGNQMYVSLWSGCGVAGPSVGCNVLPSMGNTGPDAMPALSQQTKQLQVDADAAMYKRVQSLLGYTFTDVRLLQLVLCPRGASSDAGWGTVRTLAMEGDAVLDLCIIKAACHANPELTTKALELLKRRYVTNVFLARLAQMTKLEPIITSILCNRLQKSTATVVATATVVEALFGAIHRDCCAAGKGTDAALQHVLVLLDKHMAGSIGGVARLARGE